MKKKVDRFDKYIEVMNSKLSPKELSKKLNLPSRTIYDWMKRGHKPFSLSLYTLETLRAFSIVTKKQIENYKEYGLIRD